MSGFKNKEMGDWKARKDRGLGIRAWFTHFGIPMATTPFVAIDDSVHDFNIYNRKFVNYPRINFIETGTAFTTAASGIITPDPLGVISLSDADNAINILRSHPNYTGKK
jgi:hypothetical protein